MEEERFTLTPKGIATAKEALRLFGEGVSYQDIVAQLDLSDEENLTEEDAQLYVRMLVTIAEMQGVLD